MKHFALWMLMGVMCICTQLLPITNGTSNYGILMALLFILLGVIDISNKLE